MKTLIISVIAISLLYSLNATAGASSGGGSVVVEFDEYGGGYAQGALYWTRASDNDVEMIGCGIKRNESGLVFNPTTGHGRSFCYARDADGVEIFCWIENESVAESLNAMTDSSWIAFYMGEDNVCQRVDITNYSLNLPYVKDKK